MKFLEEFSGTVIRLGGFQIALNFLSMLGKKFCSSGLEDLLMESGEYATEMSSAVMKGMSYNRGIQTHKLAMETLSHLMWDAFIGWHTSHAGDG